MPHDSYKLGEHDRIRIAGANFRVVERTGRNHVLQLVTDNLVLDKYHEHLSDERLAELRRTKKILIDRGYYSRAEQLLRARGCGSDLSDLDDETLGNIAWKVEWCTRFNAARIGSGPGGRRLPKTPHALAEFIKQEMDEIHRWYIETFGRNRPVGRKMPGDVRKPFDYPGPTALRDWLDRFEADRERSRAFRPGYQRSGRRNQLDPRVLSLVERYVPQYASRALPTIHDIHQKILGELHSLNEGLPRAERLTVSERTICNRVRRLHPIFVEAGRLGIDRTRNKYTPVADGLRTLDGLVELDRMERVEMDDWEMDLHTVLKHRHVRGTLADAVKLQAARLRKDRATVSLHCDSGDRRRHEVYRRAACHRRGTVGSRVEERTENDPRR